MSRIGIAALIAFASLSATPSPAIQNISTRALVQTGDNVMIGGFILSGVTNQLVLLRAIGPSFSAFGDATITVYSAPITPASVPSIIPRLASWLMSAKVVPLPVVFR